MDVFFEWEIVDTILSVRNKMIWCDVVERNKFGNKVKFEFYFWFYYFFGCLFLGKLFN